MNLIIEDFTNILIKDKKDNTYKFALARVLLDYINKNYIKKNREIINIKITYEEIAENFLKYYWNQVVVYKLKQDFKIQKPAKIVSLIEEKTKYINEVYDFYFKNNKNIELKKELIEDIYKYCLVDVIPRFQRDNKQNIYLHNAKKTITKNQKIRYNKPEKENRYIILKKEAIDVIIKNHNLLFETIILEWSRFLEKTNFTPRLIEKVQRINNPKRNNLTKYRKILLDKGNINCFYCDKLLDLEIDREIHVDHFIPWSYIFEDNEWNLVLSCQDCNSKKSNLLPTKKCLNKLKEQKKYLEIDNDLIDNYYKSCKKAGFSKEFSICD